MDIMKTVGERVKQWFDSYGYECYGRRGGYADGVFLPEESDIRIEFIGIQYGALTPYEIKPMTIERSEFVNHGSLANKQTFSVSKKTASSFTFTFKESIGVKISAKANIPLFGSSKVETSLNFESTQAQSTSVEQVWTYSTDINVAPHKKVVTSFIVHEARYSVPFIAKVRARGRARMAYPGRYPHYVNEKTYWNMEIDDMLQPWGASWFEFDLPGTFDAVHGATYAVQVDEFDLEPASSVTGRLGSGAVLDAEPLHFSTLDCGVLNGSVLESNLSELKAKLRQAERMRV